jgi:hypothetical protein
LLPHHQKRSLGLLSDHQLLIQKRMKSEPIKMKLEMEEDKSLMQQLHRAALRKNLNPT